MPFSSRAPGERLAQIDPENEAAHRALMQRELASGNRAAALRWYAHLREALQQGLGVSPDAQTQALYQRCIAGLQAAGLQTGTMADSPVVERNFLQFSLRASS